MKESIVFQLLFIVMLPFYGRAMDTAQYPEIGKPCPEFTLNDIQYYHKTQASLADFRGKWLVLDFWSEYCAGCINGFPKMNTLKEKFGDKVEFILIGLPRNNSISIRTLYEKCRKAQNLQLPVVYDKKLGDRFYTHGLPLIIVIDPQGIIQAITYALSADNIQDFISGKKPSVPRNYLLNEDPAKNYDYNLPLLVNNNGSNEMDFLYRSVLTKWNEAMPRYSIRLSKNRFEALGVDLKTLYKLAYIGKDTWSNGDDDTALYGKFFSNPILEINDSSLFQLTESNKFCYSTCFPGNIVADKVNHFNIIENKRLQSIIKNDLENYFGYETRIEVRKMPYYKLIATKEAKVNLKTKGGPSKAEEPNGPKQGRFLKNVPIKAVISAIYLSIGCPINHIPIIDETEVKDNIDIRIDAVFFDQYLKELKKNGLDLILGEKEMKVLVIRDKK
jgi:thiol-disulfide isomerase/thioredoxin